MFFFEKREKIYDNYLNAVLIWWDKEGGRE